MSKQGRALPRGAANVCLDAMILIGFAEADLVDELGNLFAGHNARVFTSAWLFKHEIEIPSKKYEANKRILPVTWLEKAPVTDEDVLYVENLLKAWGSDAGRDRGEAEIVALCTRHNWTGVSDDNKAHGVPELQGQRRPFRPAMIHGASLLACAAADNLIAVEDAWAIHQAVEARYDLGPPLMPIDDEYGQAFSDAVTVIRKTRDKLGSPPWPHLLQHGPDRILQAAVRRRRAQLTP